MPSDERCPHGHDTAGLDFCLDCTNEAYNRAAAALATLAPGRAAAALAEVAAALTAEAPAGSDVEYLVDYRCPRCGREWQEVYDCACDSACDACGLGDVTALAYEELLDPRLSNALAVLRRHGFLPEKGTTDG